MEAIAVNDNNPDKSFIFLEAIEPPEYLLQK